jgi:hypothetical protein
VLTLARCIPSPKISKRVSVQSSPTHEVKGGEHLDRLRARMAEKGAILNLEKRIPLKRKASTPLPCRPMRIAVVTSPAKTLTRAATAPTPQEFSPYLRSSKAVFGYSERGEKTEALDQRFEKMSSRPLRRPLTPLSDRSTSVQRSLGAALQDKGKVGSSLFGKENSSTFLLYFPPGEQFSCVLNFFSYKLTPARQGCCERGCEATSTEY